MNKKGMQLALNAVNVYRSGHHPKKEKRECGEIATSKGLRPTHQLFAKQ